MRDLSDPIIFFDGVCNLCNSSVQIVIRNDKKNLFYFSSLQSDFTREFFLQKHFNSATDSIILFYKGRFYDRSSAALKIAGKLRFPFPLLQAGWILPAFFRNWFYNLIAKNRYKWFGRTEQCMVPSPELLSRFIL